MNAWNTNEQQRSNNRVVMRTNQYSRIKNRVVNKKDVSHNVVTQFEDPIYVHTKTMHQNPHESKQRCQILQIQTKQPDKIQVKQILKSDISFLTKCRNLQYDVQAHIRTLLNPQITPQLDRSWVMEQKNPEVQLGKNIIKLSSSTKYRNITDPFNSEIAQNQLQDSIVIRGDFQSGNLGSFYRVATNEYAIQLKNDTNTRGYTQWFQLYIQIGPSIPQQTFINFIIFNIRKPIKFIPGMKLLTRGYKHEFNNYQDWQRNLDFQFFENNLGNKDNKKYYSIAFSIQANKLKKGLFVALAYPYPFSRLIWFCQQINSLQSVLKITEIGKTTLGNPILLYRVQRDNIKVKKNVFIISRQHASETSSSFICEFIIKRLTIFNCFRKTFNQYNWHIIPMANSDGVIHGNSRTSIRGYDINRCWALHLLNNSIQAQVINNYIKKINVDSDDIFLDIHSHNRELGMFSYYNFQNEFIKIFNSKMSELCKYYDIQKCRVGYDPSKRNTFRVQMNQQHKIKNTITLQTSFYGYFDKNTNQLQTFCIHDYEEMAISILKCIQCYAQKQYSNQERRVDSTEKLKIQAQRCYSLYKQQIQSQSQSDTDPEGDYLNEEDRKDLEQNTMTFIYYPQNKKQIEEQKRTLSAKSNYGAKNTQGTLKVVKEIPQQHIVNLFEATAFNQSAPQFNFVQNKFKTISLGKTKISNQIFMSIKNEQILKSTKNKNDLNDKSFREISYSSKQFNTQNYIQRKSFKNLFKSAQLRNQRSQRLQICKRMQAQHQVEDPKPDSKIFVKKTTSKKQPFRITFSQSVAKKTNNVKNIVFPSKLIEKDQYEKKMKAIEQNWRKKNIQLSSKYFILQKKGQYKQKINQNQSSNKKIALLCQYARNINNLSTLH